jgi:hypothetical protein
MTDREYMDRLLDLSTEFGRLTAQNEQLAARIPLGAAIVFQMTGDEEFNRRTMAIAKERHEQDPSVSIIIVHVDGIAPLTSRLLNPHLEPASL